jgi:predicted metal-binding integral membrane protein DUF2182
MPGMDGMPMPGGWTMSKAWMRMPGQSWPGAAISFVGTWVAMMVAMMLPSLVPALGRYRDGVGPAAGSRLARLTAIVGTAYFVVWTALGLVVFSLGAGLAAIAMREPALARLVPLATGVVVLLAGVFQWSAWKARRRAAPAGPRPTPPPPGGTGSPSAFGAAAAVRVSRRSCWSAGSWTCARWPAWRPPSPPSAWRRAARPSRERPARSCSERELC